MLRGSLIGICLSLGAGTLPAQSDMSPSPAGYWAGTLKVGLLDLRLSFHVTRKGDIYRATLDSPDQGAFGLLVTTVNVKERKVELILKDLGARYEGTLSEDGTIIDGILHQGGQELPLQVKRLEKAPVYARPQDPKRPLPYHEEDVEFENDKAKVRLAGTLTRPKGEGPFPAVILISGSGPQDRDEALFGHRPFLVLSDHLTRKGVAVLRFDDRGVGKSTGKFWDATTYDHAEDVRAGIQYLRTRKEIDEKRIGLIGHSEGGLIAPLIAKEDATIAFIVLLAAPGLPGEMIVESQVERLPRQMGMNEKVIAWNLSLQRKLAPVLKEETDEKKATERMRQLLEEAFKELEKLEPASVALLRKTAEAQLQPITFKWTRTFMLHDPRPVLRKVSCPVLAVNGGTDVQVEARPNLNEIGKALIEANNKDITLKEFAGLNHMFQRSKTGAIAEYGVLQTTIAPDVLEFVSSWISVREK